MGSYGTDDAAAWENQAAAYSHAYPPSYTAVPYAPSDPTPGVYDTRGPEPQAAPQHHEPVHYGMDPPYANNHDVPTHPPALHRDQPPPRPVACAYCGTTPASATGVIWLGVDDPRHHNHHTQQAFCSAVHAGWYMVERHPEGHRARNASWHDPAGVGDQGFVAAWADDGEELPVVAPVVLPPEQRHPPSYQWQPALSPQQEQHPVQPQEQYSPPREPQQWATPQWSVRPSRQLQDQDFDEDPDFFQRIFDNEGGELLPVVLTVVGVSGATLGLWVLFTVVLSLLK